MWVIVVLLSFLLRSVTAVGCAPGTCEVQSHPVPSLKGTNQVLGIGLVMDSKAADNVTSISLARWAAQRINANPSILPNISLQIYSIQYSRSDPVGDLEIVMNLANAPSKIFLSILDLDDTYTSYVAEILSAYNIIPLHLNSTSSLYVNKSASSMLIRTALGQQSLEVRTTIQILLDNQIRKVAYIYGGSYASGSSVYLFTQYAMEFNITVLPYESGDTDLEGVKSARAIILDVFFPRIFGRLLENKFYGPSYLYIVTSAAQVSLNVRLTSLTAGCFSLHGTAPTTTTTAEYYENILSEWATVDREQFPISDSSLNTSWAYFDAVNAFASAVQQFLNNGTDFNELSPMEIRNTMITSILPSMTGIYQFDPNGDRLGVIAIDNYPPPLVPITETSPPPIPVRIGEVYWTLGTSNISYTNTTPIFSGGNTESPGTYPRIWEKCDTCKTYAHSTNCTDMGVCTCEEFYNGSQCEFFFPPPPIEVNSTKRATATWAVPTSIFSVLAILIALAIYRRTQIARGRCNAAMQNFQISTSELQLIDRIGSGTSGEVLRGLYRGTNVAVKFLQLTSASEDMKEKLHQQTAFLCKLRHPNIVLFMGYHLDQENEELFIVTELMRRGSLYDALLNVNVPQMPYKLQIYIAQQVAQSLQFLHSLNPPIVHGNLKSRNILLDNVWNVRISNFGLSQFKALTFRSALSLWNVGALYWVAPEVLAGSHPTEKSDIYSFGIVLWELFHRNEPYYGMDPLVAASNALRSQQPPLHKDVPEPIKALIKSCWSHDPVNRPAIKDVISTLQIGKSNTLPKNSSLLWSLVPPPSGRMYFVNTEMVAANYFWSHCTRAFQKSIKLHNKLLRELMKAHNGYEVQFNLATCGFTIVFASLCDSVNFCICVQMQLLLLQWPAEILGSPYGSLISSNNGDVVWRGPRVRMALSACSPTCEVNPANGRAIYSGDAVTQSQRLLSEKRLGSITVSQEVAKEIVSKHLTYQEEILIEFQAASVEGTSRIILPKPLSQRTNYIRDTYNIKMTLHNITELTKPTMQIHEVEEKDLLLAENEIHPNHPIPPWMIRLRDLNGLLLSTRGQSADFYKAKWNGQEVLVKIFANQSITDRDMINLVGDAYILKGLDHANVLPLLAMCVEPNYVGFVFEIIDRGNLPTLLCHEHIPISFYRRLEIARDIAVGMAYLSEHIDESVKIHSNFKSNNIYVTEDWIVKIGDICHSTVRSITKNITSITSTTFQAPEFYNGLGTTAKSAIYSYGMILWELLTFKAPFADEDPMLIVAQILAGRRPPIPLDCPLRFTKLIQDCWLNDPDFRPSWHVIITELTFIIQDFQP